MKKGTKKRKDRHVVDKGDVRLRLEEAEETLRAIRTGKVDALVVSGPQGDQVYSLKGAEQPYRVFVEAMNEGAVTLGPDGTILYCNSRFGELLQERLEQIIGSEIYRFIDPADRVGFESALRRGRQEGNRVELSLKRRDGLLVPVYLSLNPFVVDELSAVCTVVMDLTERKFAENVIRAEHAFRKSIEDSLICGIAAADLQGRQLYVNPGFCRMVGWDEKELVGAVPPYVYWPPEEEDAIKRVFDSVIKGKGDLDSKGAELRFRRKNEERFDVLVLNSPLRNGKGELIGWIGSVNDITEKKQTERRLKYLSSELLTAQEKERKLIASEVHDSIGSSLGAIKYRMEQIFEKGDMGDSEDIIPIIQKAIEESRRIQTALRPPSLDDLGILPTLQWFCREFQKTYSGIEIKTQLSVEEKEVPNEVKTVIYRICQEAFNNIAKHSKAKLAMLSLRKRKPDKIELVIEDNGKGFDLQRKLAVEDFSKGLGLTSMRERAELSGAVFVMDSTPGSGTTIRISWPL